MKTQIIADDLIVHVRTLNNVQQLQRSAWPLAKSHQLKYITIMAANGSRPLTISVRQLERSTRQAVHHSSQNPQL